MSTCVLQMSSFDIQHIDNQLTTIELEERFLPQNLLDMNEVEPVDEVGWILDEIKYSRKQKRSFSDYAEADYEFQQSKRQEIGSGSIVLKESFAKLSPVDKATFKAIILEKTKNGPMDFGPYYVIEQVEDGKINIIQKDMWTRMRYIAAKFDSSVHLIDNWNKVYKGEENLSPTSTSMNVVSPTVSDCDSTEDDTSSVKKPSSPTRIRFAPSDNVFYI